MKCKMFGIIVGIIALHVSGEFVAMGEVVVKWTPDIQVQKKEWNGGIKYENINGKFCGVVDNKDRIISRNFIPISPAKEYTLSGTFKSLGNKESIVYYGFITYDNKKRRIYNFNSNAAFYTSTVLAKGCEKGDKKVLIRANRNWEVGQAIAFNAEDDYSDLPNYEVVYKITQIIYKGENVELHLSNAVPKTYPAGTKVRMHSISYGACLYTTINGLKIPRTWKTYSNSATYALPGEMSYQLFPPGTAFVKILIFPNYQKRKDEKLAFTDLSLKAKSIREILIKDVIYSHKFQKNTKISETPVIDCSKYETIKICFDVLVQDNKDTICFLDANNKVMARIKLPKTKLHTFAKSEITFNQNVNKRSWEQNFDGKISSGIINSNTEYLTKVVFQDALVKNIVVRGERKATEKQLFTELSSIALNMDKSYYSAGTKVDVANFDLQELIRQGKKVNPALLSKIDSVDKEMRLRWMELDRKCDRIFKQLSSVPPIGEYTLEIENLENKGMEDAGWFGVHKISLEWPDGTTIVLPISAFKNSVYRRHYNHQCKAADVIFVYGKKSANHTMITGFNIEKLPTGSPKLVLTALDHDKVGKAKICIKLNGQSIFKGPNPFKKAGWSNHEFPVASSVFSAKGNNSFLLKKCTMDQIKKWTDAIADFKKWANAQADEIDKQSAVLRKNLVYKPLKLDNKCWDNRFARGICFESHADKESDILNTTMYHNKEHLVKSFRSSGIDFVYGYLRRQELFEDYLAEFNKMGLPYIQALPWLMRSTKIKWHPQEYEYFTNKDKLLKEIELYCGSSFSKYNNFAGVAIDEPCLPRDASYKSLMSPDILKMFGKYLEKHASELAVAGVDMPAERSKWGSVDCNSNEVLWMFRQLFNRRLIADHWKWVYKELAKKDRAMLTIIMDWNAYCPQGSSYVTMGELPVIGTDLYCNGDERESFGMQLLHNAASGKAIFVPGAGYSCKSPEKFRRSMSTGLIHSDGILQWMHIFLAKYRNLAMFWRVYRGKAVLDDRGRSNLQNWNPEYWDILVDIYKRAGQADKYLFEAESIADIAVLQSELTGIANTRYKDWSCRDYYYNGLAIYSAFIKKIGRSVDAAYIDSLTASKLDKYKVIVLSDARVLSVKAMKLLSKWVKNGGTLIAGGESSLYSPWGKKQKNFVLSNLFGIDFVKEGSDAKSFKYKDININYGSSKVCYSKVKLKTAIKLADWNNGDPALTKNKFGKGNVIFFTARNNDRKNNLKITPLIIRFISESAVKPPVSISNLPDGVEVQLRKAKDGSYVLHMLDWIGNRKIKNVSVSINKFKNGEVLYPGDKKIYSKFKSGQKIELKPFHIYDLVVIRKNDNLRRR